MNNRNNNWAIQFLQQRGNDNKSNRKPVDLDKLSQYPKVLDIYYKALEVKKKYDTGLVLMDRGNYNDAITSFNHVMDYKDSVDRIQNCIKLKYTEEYIQYFFKHICDIKQNSIYFKKIEETYSLSIVKDKVERLTDKDSSGKLMERTWRNCLFHFISKNEVKYSNSNNMMEIAQKIFDEMKSKHAYLFVRSYFYIAIIVQNDPLNISKNDFFLYYFNTNYKFGQVNGKTNIFNNVKYSFVVEDIDSELKSMKDKNMDSIDCAKAYHGMLEIYEATQEKMESICSMIDKNQETRLIIEGPARSGKTIIAMQLLNKYPQAKFLLMNYYFYIALKDSFAVINKPFPRTRIFHHDLNERRTTGCGVIKGDHSNGWTKKFAFDLDFVVIDEAQRLTNLPGQQGYKYYFPGFNELDLLVTRPKVSILLGDDYQRINPKYDEGFKKIKETILHSKKEFINYRFNETIGIPVNLVNSFIYILDKNSTHIDSIGNHTIRLFNNASDIVSDFNDNPTYSKHYVTLPSYSLPYQFTSQGVSIYPETLRYSDYPFFLNSETMHKYVHTTYEVISRELQSLYLIIPDSISYSSIKGIYDSNGLLNQQYLFNHLYVNMTRATQRLVIFTQNKSLFDYLQKRISEVSNVNFDDQWKSSTIVEQKINFVYSLSSKASTPLLENVLRKNGFEGFVHATEFSNLLNILSEDKLISRSGIHDNFVDVADQNVIYLTNQFVKSKVRLYYKTGTPTLYHFNNKSSNLCILIFEYKIVEDHECYFSDGNAASKYTRFVGDIDEAIKFNWIMIFSRGPISEIDKQEVIRVRNAELLVNSDIICSKYLKRIYVKNEHTKNNIIDMFPKYHDRVIVDASKF